MKKERSRKENSSFFHAPQRTLLFLVFQQLQVFGDQLASLFYAVRGSVRILRCVEQIVLEFVDCGGCYMHSCIAGCIVDVNLSVLTRNRAVCKYNVGNVSDSLFSKRNQEYTGRLCNDFGRIVQIGTEDIQNVAKACCCISYTVCNVDPAFLTADRHCSGTVFGLGQGMINTFADDLLLVDDSVCDIIAESEADSPPLPVSMKPSIGRV